MTAWRCTGAPTTWGPPSWPRSLIPLLLATAQEATARLGWSTLSPSLHARGRNDGLDGDLTPYDSWTAYGTSKLALVHEASRDRATHGDRGLHGYSVHPGSVATNIAARGLETAPLLGVLRKLAGPLERRALKSPYRRRPVGGPLGNPAQAEPGGYHRSWAPSTPSEDAQDEEAGRILWDNTSAWVDKG